MPSLDAVNVTGRLRLFPVYGVATTRPFARTTATAESPVRHSILLPLSWPPELSRGVAARSKESLSAIVRLGAEIESCATGTGITVSVTEPDAPPLEAVMETSSGAPVVTMPAVTVPDAETVATVARDVDQLMVRPASTAPDDPWGVADNVTLPPLAIEVDGDDTSIRATASGAEDSALHDAAMKKQRATPAR